MIKKFCSFSWENIISFFNKIKVQFGNTILYTNKPKKNEFLFSIVNDTELLVKQTKTKPQETFNFQKGNSGVLLPCSTEIRRRCKMDLRSSNFQENKCDLQTAVKNKKPKRFSEKKILVTVEN